MGNADIPLLHSRDKPFDANLLEGDIPLSSKKCGKNNDFIGKILARNFAIALVLHCHGLWLTKNSRATLYINKSEVKIKPKLTRLTTPEK